MPDDRGQLHDKLFEAVDEPDEQSANLRPGAMELLWRCTECGYVQIRTEPLPDGCPNCGAEKEAFVLVDED